VSFLERIGLQSLVLGFRRIGFMYSLAIMGMCLPMPAGELPCVKAKAMQLDVSATLDCRAYKVGQVIRVHINLINKSDDVVFIPSFLEWGLSASFSVSVRDETIGKDLDCGFGDALAPPPISARDFIKLRPDYSYGQILNIELPISTMIVGHVYRVKTSYHSPISNKFKSDISFISHEDGEVDGSGVTFEVIK